jgi:DNA-binding beta-propeller fold protein YncE
MTATGQCLYYDAGNAAQSLDAICPISASDANTKDCTSVPNEASDWLQTWDRAATGREANSSYYEGNIKTCADKGMRLPVAYETSMTKPRAGLPTGDGITPTWASRDNAIFNEPFLVHPQEVTPQDIFFKPDGTKMYVIGSTSDSVHEYVLGDPWNVYSASYSQVFSVAAQETAPTGIFFKPDGTKMYVIGHTGDDVNEYTLSHPWNVSSASYVQIFSVAAQETTPNDIFFKPDGTKMYVIGSTGDDVNEYTLSDPWNVSSASYVQIFSVAAQETAPTGIFFKPDGTKMYVIGSTGDDVNEYTLSDPWNVSTASYVQVFSVNTEETTPTGIFFKPDGTKMYVIGQTGDDVNEYTLSDPWNVSSASYVQIFSVAAQETAPTGIFFNPDGTRMYVLGDTNDFVSEYTLGTAWNVSTASYVQNFSVAAEETVPTGIFFKPDGTKMYVIGSTGDDVNEYSLGTAWQLVSPDGVPSHSSSTWTASAYTGTTVFYWVWSGTSSYDLNYYYGSRSVRCVLPGYVPWPPAAPTSVSGTAGWAQVSLTWTAPASNGDSLITDYVVQYSSNSGSTWTTFADGTSTSTSATVTGLTNGTAYIFRVAATNSAGTGSYSSNWPSVTPVPDLYLNTTATNHGEAQGPGGVTMEYVFANGASGFKIWKEKGGSRILNATGLVANGWQKQLNRAGTAFSTTDFTVGANIAGRVCPPNVFLSHTNMTATGRCLYYDAGNAAQKLNAANGTVAEDFLLYWSDAQTGKGTSSSFYEGNIKTCADKGMRLPALYETTAPVPQPFTSSGPALPNGDGITPAYASSYGVPSLSDWTWTASGDPGTWHYGRGYIYHLWRDSSFPCDFWGCEDATFLQPVRCVLP